MQFVYRAFNAQGAMTSGTMIQPYYFGKTFYLGLEGSLLELTVKPAQR